ncbi:uncharacterized protein KZ484_015811 isoform 2-T2 [Pholidichthys leucotaenia]
MAEKKRSIVWAYFTPVDKIIANCNVCKRDIRHCNNTTNMFKHMLKHEKENSELQRRRTEHGNPTSTAGPEPVLGSLHGSEPAEKLSLITSCGRPIMESIVGGSSMSPSGSSMSIVYVQTDSDGEIRLLKPAIATTYSRQKEDFQASSSLSDSPVQEGKQSKLDQSGGLEVAHPPHNREVGVQVPAGSCQRPYKKVELPAVQLGAQHKWNGGGKCGRQWLRRPRQTV